MHRAPFGGIMHLKVLLFHSRSIAVSYSSDGYTFEPVFNCVEIHPEKSRVGNLYFVLELLFGGGFILLL